jgi:hypothetical protein
MFKSDIAQGALPSNHRSGWHYPVKILHYLVGLLVERLFNLILRWGSLSSTEPQLTKTE